MPAFDPMKRSLREIARREFPLGRRDRKWLTLFKEFDLLPIATQAAGNDVDFDLTGTGTVPAPTFLSPANGMGGILLATRSTSAADNDEAHLFPLSTTRWGQSVLAVTGDETELDFWIRTGSTLVSTGFYVGAKLTDTAVYATDNDQVLIGFDSDSMGTGASTTQLNAVTSIGGTDTFTPIGAATASGSAAADTEYKLSIRIDINRKVSYYVNNGLRYTHSTALTASAALKITFGVMNRLDTPGGVGRSHGIRGIRWSNFVA